MRRQLPIAERLLVAILLVFAAWGIVTMLHHDTRVAEKTVHGVEHIARTAPF